MLSIRKGRSDLSTTDHAASVLKTLEPKDWSVLYTVEKGMNSFEYVPLSHIMKSSKLHSDEIKFRLSRLNRISFVTGGPSGYCLQSAGLDAIALNLYVKKNMISALGKPLGVGKESDVYEAVSEKGEFYALKFFRMGRTSFRDIRRKRGYSFTVRQHRWLLQNILAARREYDAIRILRPLGIAVPEVFGRERHTVLMEKVEGTRLSEWGALESPDVVIRQILRAVRDAYLMASIVNGDLSEYNVLYDGEKIMIIDWPQAVLGNHKNSIELLKRDLSNIQRFFRRRFRINYELERAFAYVKGEEPSIYF